MKLDYKEVREFLKKDSIAADYTFPYHFEDDENGKKIMHESDPSESFGTYIFLYNQGENLANYSNTFIIGETRIEIKTHKDSCTLKSRHILNKKKKKQAPFELKDDTIYFIGRCPKINDDSNSTTEGDELSSIEIDNDSTISRLHCNICRKDNGWEIYDEHSSNGVYVKLPNKKFEIKKNKLLRIGRFTYCFFSDGN